MMACHEAPPQASVDRGRGPHVKGAGEQSRRRSLETPVSLHSDWKRDDFNPNFNPRLTQWLFANAVKCLYTSPNTSK